MRIKAYCWVDLAWKAATILSAPDNNAGWQYVYPAWWLCRNLFRGELGVHRLEPISTPPAVPSERVSFDGKSNCLPAFKDSYITHEFSGETPYMLILLFLDFKYPPTPEISPPPPTEINTESTELSSLKTSKPRVHCPEIIVVSLIVSPKATLPETIKLSVIF